MIDGLKLPKGMVHPRLIQRLEKPHYGETLSDALAFGGGFYRGGFTDEGYAALRKIFSFDYMGDSAFEWGAVPKAVQFLAAEGHKGRLTVGQYLDIFYICPKSHEEGVRNIIRFLLHDERTLRLNEPTFLASRVFHVDEFTENLIGWLELDNCFFLFISEQAFNQTRLLMGHRYPHEYTGLRAVAHRLFGWIGK